MAHLPRYPAVLRHMPCPSGPLSPCPSHSFSQEEASSCFVPLSTCCCCFQLLSYIRLFATPWAAARQASLSFTVSQSLLKLMSIESEILYSHLIICCSFSSWPQSSQPQGFFFPMSWLFTSGGQKFQHTGASASASILSMSSQG